MNPRQRPPPSHPSPEVETTYNIIPLNKFPANHPSLRFPEVRVTIEALKAVGDLRRPPFIQWKPHYDLLDWLGAFFGFQCHNVLNQREHLVLHLANAQMRLHTPPDDIDSDVLRCFRVKLLSNYTHWCSFLGRKSNVWVSDSRRKFSASDHRRELLYVSLYLLIWGESANLRFIPECICYIFHHMAMELNRILEDYIDENTEPHSLPSLSGENAFLNRVVKPIYDLVKAEVANSKNGRAPHSNWRNYDDINEYFWSRRCFEELNWPIDITSNFFVTTSNGERVGKTGFVEQRSFLNLFRSFDKLWTTLFLFLQAAIIVAWKDPKVHPWKTLLEKDIQAKVLSVFITWSSLRLLKALLDAVMGYKLVSRDSWLGVRMVLKIIVSSGWVVVFSVLYARIWSQKKVDLAVFLKAALVFILPEIIAQVLFILPIPSDLIETTNWKIFYLITWWSQTRAFVGRGLREGLVEKTKYTLFWVVVLATKFCFSYFLQIKPMIQPTKDLLDHSKVTYEWHQFFRNSNRFAVGLLWLPVVLIYLMDLQIWYSIYSSFVGAMVGLFSHLGEIRNVQQLKLRFQFFAGAMQFNLMPLVLENLPITSNNPIQTLWRRIKDRIHRISLRYGLVKNLESNQVEAHKVALIWNEIILAFREEDIISDREVRLLVLPRNPWNVRVVQWPLFLLSNELELAISQAEELAYYGDKFLWYKISKKEYRRCSVIETYDSVKHLLQTIVESNTPEHSILMKIFQEIEESILQETFTKTFNMTRLSHIRIKVMLLFSQLTRSQKNVNEVVKKLQDLYESIITDFYKKKRTMENNNALAPDKLLFQNAVNLPDPTDDNFYQQVRRMHLEKQLEKSLIKPH